MSNSAITKQQNIENYANKHLHQFINKAGVWQNYANPSEMNTQMEDLLSDAQNAIKVLDEYHNNSNESATENALHKLQGQFEAEEYYLSEMRIFGDQDVDFGAGIKLDSTIYHMESIGGYNPFGNTTEDLAKAENTRSTTLRTDVETCLTSIDSSITLSDLIGSFNGLTNDTAIETDSDQTKIYLDTQTEKTMLNDLVKMMKDQVEIDNHMTEKTPGGNTKALSDYQEMLLENDQSTLYSSMKSTLRSDQKTLEGKEDALRKTIASMPFWKLIAKVFHIPTDGTEKAQLNKDKALFQTLITAENDLDSVGADIAMRAFNSVMNSIDGLIKEMKKILSDTHLSPKEKQAKLSKLLQFMLGFLQIFIQIVENCRSKNKQKMEKAETVAQKLNFQTIKTNSEIFTSLQKTEKTSKIVQDVMKGVEIALSVCFVLTGNIGMAVMMGTMFALQETGVLSTLTTYFASKEDGSQTGASFTMAGITLAATMVGGVGIDLLAERMVNEVATAAADGVEEEVAGILADTATEAGSTAIKDTADTATEEETTATDDVTSTEKEPNQAATEKNLLAESYKKLVTETTKRAVKAAARESYKKISLAALGKTIWKSLADSEFRKEASAGLRAEMKVFCKEIGERAYKDSVTQLKRVAEENPGKELTDKEINSFADKTASKLVTEPEKDLGENPSFLKKLRSGVYGRKLDRALDGVPRLRNALYSGVAAGTYTLAATNLGTNVYAAECADHHKKEKNGIEILLDIVQEIVQMLAMVKGGGALDAMKSGDPSPALAAMFKGAAGLQILEQGTQVFCSVEKGITLDQQAAATKAIQVAQAYDNEIRAISGQDKSSTDPSSSGLNIEYKRLEQEQAWLAEHIADNSNAGNRVLLAQSV